MSDQETNTSKTPPAIAVNELIFMSGALIGVSSKLSGMARYIEDSNIASELTSVSKDLKHGAIIILKAIHADHLIECYRLEKE